MTYKVGYLPYTSSSSSLVSYDGLVAASDYATLQEAITASVDASKALLLNKSFTVTATIPLLTANSNILGLGRDLVTITAGADLAGGVFDIRSDGCRMSGFTVDGGGGANTIGIKIGHLPGTDTGTAYKGVLRDVEIQDCQKALMMCDNVDYWTMDRLRMMDGNINCIDINNPASTNYDNGHVDFYDCEMSATYSCLQRSVAVAGSFHRLNFFGGGFAGGQSNNYMVDTSNIHECRFYGAYFEATDGLNNGPDDAMLYLNSYSSGCYGCTFSFKDNTAGYDGVKIASAYSPYPFYGNHMENSVAGQHIHAIGSGRLAGLEAVSEFNCAGTSYSGVEGSNNATTASLEPTIQPFSGNIQIWHDSDDNKVYLIAYANGGQKKVELL